MQARAIAVLATIGLVAVVWNGPTAATVTASVDSLVNAPGFEDGWNALFVSEIRASLRADPVAKTLRKQEREIARRELTLRASHIAHDALALRDHWTRTQLEQRIAAGRAESTAVALRGTDPVAARSHYETALTCYRDLGERRRAAWVLGGMGVAAFQSHDWVAADSLHRLSLQARRNVGDARMIGNSLNDLGTTARQRERYEEARYFLEGARTVRESTGQAPQLGATLGFLGAVLADMGRPDSAVVHFERGLELLGAAGDSARVQRVLVDLAVALVDAGRADEADAALERAAAAAPETEELRGRIAFEHGRAALADSRFASAIVDFRNASGVFRASEDPVRLRASLIELSRALILAGEAGPAWTVAAEAESLAHVGGSESDRALALNNLAAAARQGEAASASDSLARESLSAAVRAGDSLAVHDACTSLYLCAVDRRDLDAAGRWLQRAQATGAARDTTQAIDDRIRLAIVATLQSRLDDAEHLLVRATHDARRIGSSQLASYALINLADVAERRKDYVRAVALGREALAAVDSVRTRQSTERSAIRVFAERIDAFDAFIHLLVRIDPLLPDSGFAAEAFTWAERSRARSLLERRLGGAHAASLLSLARAQALLGPHEALLEYSVGDSSTTLWIVRRDQWSYRRLPNVRRLRSAVNVLRADLTSADLALSKTALGRERSLYRMLVEPAESQLHGVERLIVVPEGPLAQLPFEVLRTDDAHPTSYLVERYPISYLPSASMLQHAAVSACGTGIVAVGDPAFGRQAADTVQWVAERGVTLRPLPYSALEIRALTGLCEDHPMAVLMGAEASKSRLLATPGLGRAAIIHLSTHGTSDATDPARCRLWFAPDSSDSEPSSLGVDEIAALSLCASQVTLAACQSAAGRLERGEGIIGLARAFLAAGAGSVVASLWNVNDSATAILMKRFYEELIRAKSPRDAALASSQRAMIDLPQTRSPYYWAAFQLIGERGPLALGR